MSGERREVWVGVDVVSGTPCFLTIEPENYGHGGSARLVRYVPEAELLALQEKYAKAVRYIATLQRRLAVGK